MLLKHYFPLSIGVFVLLVVTVRYFSIPVLPFAIVLLFGETLLGLLVEDQKIGRLLGDLIGAVKASSVKTDHHVR